MDAGNAPNAAGRADGQDCSPEPVWSKNSSEAAREITPQRPHCVVGIGDSNSEMSAQIIPLKGRKICGAPAEFWPQRLFAFEMRAGEMPLGPSAAGIFSKRYAPNAVPAGSYLPPAQPD
jgi:hypothetical protein